MRRIGFLAIAVVAVVGVAGCTSTVPEGKPLPDMTFEDVQPVAITLAGLEVENRYDAGSNLRDVSSEFPAALDISARRLIERRVRPAGTSGVLRAEIEDAQINKSLIEPQGRVSGWLGAGRKDHYEAALRVRLYAVYQDGTQSNHAVLNLRRSLSIPHSFSVADRDKEKFQFIEQMMDDLDKALTEAVGFRLGLAAPEVR